MAKNTTLQALFYQPTLAGNWLLLPPRKTVKKSRTPGRVAYESLNLKEDTVVIVSGDMFSTFHLTLPPVDRKALEQASGYALQEKLTQPIEHYQIFLSEAFGDNQYQATVVDKKAWQQISDLLGANLTHVKAIVPDYLALPPTEDDTLLIFHHQDHYLLRWHPHLAMSIHETQLDAVLTHTFKTHAYPQHIVSNDENLNLPQGAPELTRLDIPCTYHELANNAPLDKPWRKQGQAKWLSAYLALGHKTLAVGLAALLALTFGVKVANMLYWQAHYHHVQNQVNTILKAHVPNAVEHQGDPVAALRAKLASRIDDSQSSPFIRALANIDDSLTTGLIERITYENDQITLNLMIDDYPALEAFVARLESQGFAVKRLESDTAEGMVATRLRLTGGGL